ncbi:toprim domain-containing protein, partial [Prevotella corporis]
RDNKTFKGTIAPKDITPIFTDKIINQIQPTCVFEGFMDFLSFLSMKEEVTSACLVLNSVSNTAKAIRYMNAQGISSIRTFLDNDDAGRRAVQDFIKAGFHVEDMNIHYKGFKDLNEFHVYRVRERQNHKEQIQAHMSVTEQNQSNKSKQVKHKMR